jgi:DNA replication protein DnaC
MEQIQMHLKAIRLSGMAHTLPVRLHEAQANDLPHQTFLERLLEDELTKRRDSLLTRRVRAASFPGLKSLEHFDYSFNPSIRKQKILELASSAFVPKAENVLFLGPPGVGKTHLACAIGLCAVEKGYSVTYRSIFDLAEDFLEAREQSARRELIARLAKVDLLILDEFGMKKLPLDSAEDVLELFHRRYQKKASMICTNRPIEDWPLVLQDTAAATAILDRFLEGVHLLKITGRSYRLSRSMQEAPREESA